MSCELRAMDRGINADCERVERHSVYSRKLYNHESNLYGRCLDTRITRRVPDVFGVARHMRYHDKSIVCFAAGRFACTRRGAPADDRPRRYRWVRYPRFGLVWNAPIVCTRRRRHRRLLGRSTPPPEASPATPACSVCIRRAPSRRCCAPRAFVPSFRRGASGCCLLGGVSH
jgi:hypothetical protein